MHLHKHIPMITSVECHITCNEKILVNKRSESKEKFPGYLSIPGGHIEVGETALFAAMREVREETNVSISEREISLKYIAIHEHIDRNETWLIFGFFVELDTMPKLQDTQEGESIWMDVDEMKKAKSYLSRYGTTLIMY